KRMATKRACMCMTRRSLSWWSMISNKGKDKARLRYGLAQEPSRILPICACPSESTQQAERIFRVAICKRKRAFQNRETDSLLMQSLRFGAGDNEADSLGSVCCYC